MHLTVPLFTSMQVLTEPASSAVAVLTPSTMTGSKLSLVVPSPSSPAELPPQQRTNPPLISAQLCQPATLTSVASVSP